MDLLQEKRNSMKFTKILKQPRVIILIVFLLLAFYAINLQFSNQGVALSSVEYNGGAYLSGLRTPATYVTPTAREKVLSLNDKPVN